jgi:hypothetical protein
MWCLLCIGQRNSLRQNKRLARLISENVYRESAKKYNMHECSMMPIPFVKGDRLGIFQSLRNQLEINQIKSISYASVVGSIMYLQLCMCPDLAFVIELFVIFQSNLGMKHWKVTKKALRYLQGTKHYMLTYKKTDNLEIIGYSYADFVGYMDSQKSTLGYVFTHANGVISGKAPSKKSLHLQRYTLNL